MTTAILALVVVLLAATQPSRERTIVACAYALINIAHLVLVSPWIDGYWYYISAGAADLVIMGLIVRVVRIPAIGVSLLRLCIAEIMVNAGGWVLWWNYYDPAPYNAIYQVLQVWAVLILTRKDRADELGGYKVDRWSDYVRLVTGSRHSHI